MLFCHMSLFLYFINVSLVTLFCGQGGKKTGKGMTSKTAISPCNKSLYASIYRKRNCITFQYISKDTRVQKVDQGIY